MTVDRPPTADHPAPGALELLALACLAAGSLGLVVPGPAAVATLLLPALGLLLAWCSRRWGPWPKAGVTVLVLTPLVLGLILVLGMRGADLATVLADPLGGDPLPIALAMLVVVPGTGLTALVGLCWLALLLRRRPQAGQYS